MPVTTLVSTLPETIYDEKKEAVCDNSLVYIKVQRRLLLYLSTQAADTLTAPLACQWTRESSEDTPARPKDALRLCYYMRSQGFATYAIVKNGYIDLYLANQHTDMRGPHTDMLYWKQNLVTYSIVFAASHIRCMD